MNSSAILNQLKQVNPDAAANVTSKVINRYISEAHSTRGLPGLCAVDDFLDKEAADKLLDYAITNEQHFADAKQSNRRAQIMWHYVKDPDLFKEVAKAIADRAKQLGYEWTRYIEIQLTCSKNGDYFGPHWDVGYKSGLKRTLSYVYYLFNDANWEGGQLQFGNISVEPKHNQLVMFNPCAKHEIVPLKCGDAWAQNRFTFNGWFHQHPDKGTIDLEAN